MSNWHDTTPYDTTQHHMTQHDTTQHKKTQNGIIYFFNFLKKKFWKIFWKKKIYIFLEFLKIIWKKILNNFWRKKIIFFENFFVSFCVVSCRVLYKTHVLSRVISIWHNTFGQSRCEVYTCIHIKDIFGAIHIWRHR